MQFSIKVTLTCMLITALVVLAVAQQQSMNRVIARARHLRMIVELHRQKAIDASLRTQVCEELLNSTEVPSWAFQESLRHFRAIQQNYGDFEQLPTLPTIRMIPSISDDECDRHHVRLFIPDQGTYAIRVATFRYADFRRSNAPPLSEQEAAEILLDSPFGLSGPLLCVLTPGTHDVVTSWSVDGTGKFVLKVDGQLILLTQFTKELKSPYKYHAMGTRMNDGWLGTDRDSVTIRSVSPVEGDPKPDPEYTLRCELIRIPERRGRP